MSRHPPQNFDRTADEPSKGELAFLRRVEQELRIGRPAEQPPPGDAKHAPVPFGDDMAPLTDGPPPLLWTTDMLMDGVDFEGGKHAWRDIGHKAMAANLSDCAAMAVRPLAALCAVALNNQLSMDDALEILRGLRDCGLRFDCPITGGDTNSWDAPTVIAVTIAGRPEPNHSPVRRDGARPGDLIFLTGPVGGSILGRHLTFEPRVPLALQINQELAPHAMIDISDGLALDLGRILDASGRGAVLEERDLQAVIHPDAALLAARDGQTPLAHALHDGEDFELIVVLPPDAPRETRQRLGLLPIGQVTPAREFHLRRTDGQLAPLEKRGWEHFR